MNASWTAGMEIRAWSISLSEKLDMENRRASQEHQCATQDEVLQIMKDQSDVLRYLVELQKRKQNNLQTSPYAPSPSPKRSRRRGEGKSSIPFTEHRGQVRRTKGTIQ